MLKLLIIFVLFVNLSFSLSGKDLIGLYDVGKECESMPCPRTYLDKYDFVCPLNGKNAEITLLEDSNPENPVYQLYFKTYNMSHSNGEFKATFKDTDIYQYNDKRGEIKITMKNGYILHISPCYDGNYSNKECSNDEFKPQLLVQKSNYKSEISSGCTFTLSRYFSIVDPDEPVDPETPEQLN